MTDKNNLLQDMCSKIDEHSNKILEISNDHLPLSGGNLTGSLTINNQKVATEDFVTDSINNLNSTYLGISAKAESAKSADSVAWNNVSGKPSTFTPSAHTHDDRYYTESEIDTKLSGKSDTTHNHNSAYLGITAKAESAKSADSVAWNNVSGKPSTYTPSSHTHDDRYYTESEVDTKLNGKSSTSHNHDSTYLKLSGGTITGTISKNNNSTSWVQGRNVAPFRTIAASSPGDSQYVPCWSAKSYQGSWDCGPYVSNVLHLSYITDANFNSNKNEQTADFTFTTDGTFNAKVLKQNGTAVSLSGHTHDDRYYTESEINTKLSALLLQIYPVGAIYISASSTNPGTLFGGTWKALDQGRVLIGANSTYKAGTTGGEFTHKITTGEMPSHTHTGTTGNESAGHTHSGTTGNQSAGHTHTWSGTTSSDGSHAHTASSNSTGAHTHSLNGRAHSYSGVIANDTYSHLGQVGNHNFYGMTDTSTASAGAHSHTITVNSNGAHTHTVSGTTGGISANHTHSFTTGGISAHHNHSFTTGASGSGSAMNNMQPYLAVYMWQRTA